MVQVCACFDSGKRVQRKWGCAGSPLEAIQHVMKPKLTKEEARVALREILARYPKGERRATGKLIPFPAGQTKP